MADITDIVELRKLIVEKCALFNEKYRKLSSDKELLCDALDLITTVSVKMGMYESKSIDKVVDEELFKEVCSLGIKELQKVIKESRYGGSINILRYVVAQKLFHGEITSLYEPRKLIDEINEIEKRFIAKDTGYFIQYLQKENPEGLDFISKYKKQNPFQNWTVGYRCLLPFVYNQDLKKTVWHALEVLRDNLLSDLGISDSWECKNSQGWHHQVRSYYGFEGPSNYGSQRAVLMLHPKEIPDHKNAVQLVCYFHHDMIEYGMDLGFNAHKLKYMPAFQRWELIQKEILYDKDYLRIYKTIREQLGDYLSQAARENYILVENNPEISNKIVAEGNAELSDEDGVNLFMDIASSEGSGGGGNNTTVGSGSDNNDDNDDDFNKKDENVRQLEIEVVGSGESETEVDIKPNIKEYEDYLARKQIAQHISDNIIKNKNVEPLNIGIYGDWGSGKTQVINLIKQNLKDKTFKRTKRINKIHKKHALLMGIIHWFKRWNVFIFELIGFLICVFKPLLNLLKITKESFLYKLKNFEYENIEQGKYKAEIIDFDAWQYDDQEHIWAALIMEIMEKCMGYFWFYAKFMIYKFVSHVKNSWKEYLLWLGFICILWLILLNFGGVFGKNDTYAYLSSLPWDQQLIFAALVALIPNLLKFDFINIDEVFVKCFKMPEYKNQLGFRNKIKHLTQFALNYLSKNNKRRIVLFIDNLDRCSSSNIKQVLDSICQFLELCSKKRANLITVFAMDRQVILNALKKEGVAEEKLNVYLDKIVNLPINLSMQDNEIKNLDSLIIRLFGEEENDIKKMLRDFKDKEKFSPRKLANLRYIANTLYNTNYGHLTKKDIENYFE